MATRDPRIPNVRQIDDVAESMSRFAETFPSLRGADGVRPWNAPALREWMDGLAATGRSRRADAFVLTVWAGGEYRSGDDHVIAHVVESMNAWDDDHRAAALAWRSDLCTV